VNVNSKSSIMYGGSKNNEKDNKAEEGEGSGGWASTFFKVAGAVAATAAIAGSIYGIAKQAEAAEAEAEQGPKKCEITITPLKIL
jgi:hypothetical protein